jgi:hypothetical protein
MGIKINNEPRYKIQQINKQTYSTATVLRRPLLPDTVRKILYEYRACRRGDYADPPPKGVEIEYTVRAAEATTHTPRPRASRSSIDK